jgi:hypothetical protein
MRGMKMDEKITQIRLADGRYGETRTKEVIENSGNGERVYERYEEEPRTLHLTERVVEKQRPVVVERTIETIQNGEVVETKVESIEPRVQMQLREHIALASTQAQSQEECDCYVTKQDLTDALVAAAVEIRNSTVQAQSQVQVQPKVKLQNVIEEKVEGMDKWNILQYGLIAAIGVELAILAFQWIPRLTS